MKLPDRIKILEIHASSIQRAKESDDARSGARQWIAEMTRRAEKAGTSHEAHDAPVSYLCRYLGIEVRDFRNMLRERIGTRT
jgi:hypothetical protein